MGDILMIGIAGGCPGIILTSSARIASAGKDKAGGGRSAILRSTREKSLDSALRCAMMKIQNHGRLQHE